MSKATERLLQVAAVVALLWFGWGLARDLVIAQIIANNKINVLEQQLVQAKQAASRPAPVEPPAVKR